jgi:hypothetical protein
VAHSLVAASARSRFLDGRPTAGGGGRTALIRTGGLRELGLVVVDDACFP